MGVWRYTKRLLKHFFVPGAHNAHQPRLLHRPWLLFFLAVTLATEGFLVSNLIARQSDKQFLAAVVPAEVIALTNSERAANNVGKVINDELLDKAAQAKADDMARAGYFSHVGPDGKTPWEWISESGYQYQYAGENLAVRFIDSRDVVNAWMESPTHRANIVKPVYTQIGIGVAEGSYEGQPATYVVQYFGTPKSAEAASIATIDTSAPAAKPAAVRKPAVAPTSTKVTAQTQVAQAGAPAVEGAATAVASAPKAPSVSQSVTRQLVRAFSEPTQTSNILLGLVATLLIVALLFTFFVHVQIQHPTLLVSGAFVAVLALFFLAINTRLVSGFPDSSNAAGVAAYKSGVIITSEAAETGYAMFPQ